MRKITLPALLLFALAACTSPANQNEENQVPDKAQEVIDQSIGYHGLHILDNAEFSMSFRGIDYTYKNEKGRYEYTRTQTDSTGAQVVDILNNMGFGRYINEEEAQITEERTGAYTRSVNSVIYFFRLPFGLNDEAVNKEYMGEATIKGKTYHEVKVTFEQEGGGEDFDDVFLYWFDAEDYSMDYLAYLYHTDGGGMRFREAINQRTVDGVRVQDYINMRPENEDIDIMTIDDLYNAGELKELSRIINENIKIKAN